MIQETFHFFRINFKFVAKIVFSLENFPKYSINIICKSWVYLCLNQKDELMGSFEFLRLNPMVEIAFQFHGKNKIN